MILVPHESVAKLNDPTPPPTETQLSSLDSEMERILRKKYADDSLKWKLYNAALQRYLHFKNESKKPVRISVEDFSLDDTGDTALIRQQLVAAMPKTYKAAALRLYDYLSTTGSRVTWDSSGLVSLEGTPVTNSNIIDLISDLTRSRKNFEPVVSLNLNMPGNLGNVYHEPADPASYGTAWKLWDATGEKKEKITHYLEGEDAYTLHKPARRRFPPNVTYAGNIDESWKTDLTDFQSLKKDNDGFSYILCVIDVFSKYG
ncbi:50S ribosomal protein L5 [Frankliniella fusca]|uniref:50S ribosomal protein L5 n=1 Tax=Frankliniella fusca TaxID=407009 RepID=A0AAE1HNH2_9NEOP|nr:50S ribosomal protein L5 [Frankliniella fusca]